MTAEQLLKAIEGGELECLRDDGVVTLFVDRKPELTMPEAPTPQVTINEGNSVEILSGEVSVATIEVLTTVEAEIIADALSACFEKSL